MWVCGIIFKNNGFIRVIYNVFILKFFFKNNNFIIKSGIDIFNDIFLIGIDKNVLSMIDNFVIFFGVNVCFVKKKLIVNVIKNVDIVISK